MFDPARLIQARRLRGLTPKELAAEAGTSPQTIGLYEAGVNNPRRDHARALGQGARYTPRLL